MAVPVVVVVGLWLAGCGAQGSADRAEPSPAPEPEVLSASRAGGLYLDAVCPVNEAWDAADIEIDRLRIAQGRGATDTTAFRTAMREVAEASEAAARQLEPKDAEWPEDARDEVRAVRDSLRADAKEASRVLDLPIAEATVYTWDGAEAAGAAGAAARAALALPTDPVAGCEQWAEQR